MKPSSFLNTILATVFIAILALMSACSGDKGKSSDTVDESAAPVSDSAEPVETDDDGDGQTESQGDCDDTNSTMFTGNPEVCDDGFDNDCNGVVDGSDAGAQAIEWYADTDGDHLGDANAPKTACEKPEGYVRNKADCNDTDATIKRAKRWYYDGDGDGFGNPHQRERACEAPGPKYILKAHDCNDLVAAINPDASEGYFYNNGGDHGDGKDNNCNGDIDETRCTCESIGMVTPTTTSSLDWDFISSAQAAAPVQIIPHIPLLIGTSCMANKASLQALPGNDCQEAVAEATPDDSYDTPDDNTTTGETSCSDGSDNDGDTLIDCADTDCSSASNSCWKGTPIWRGANWWYDDGSCAGGTENMEYNELGSYFTDVSSSSASDGVTVNFDIHHYLDHGEIDYIFDSRAYYDVFAYNTAFIQTRRGSHEMDCVNPEWGKCNETDKVQLDSYFDTAWLAGKKVAVFLNGFHTDFEGPGEQSVEFGDGYATAWIDNADIPSNYELHVHMETKFNGELNHIDYVTDVSYTVFVYDPAKVSQVAVENGDWEKDGTYYEASRQGTLSSSVTSTAGSDNVLVGLKSWGFNEDIAVQMHRVGAWVWLNSWQNSIATVGMKGAMFKNGDCALVEEHLWKPRKLTARVLACSDDSVCKRESGDESLRSSSSDKRQETDGMSIKVER
ncbi:MAG: hypothetical protein A3G32_09375 [Deltaproteobacteria bacterium RIFCSPLOWO2_12_FULL_40_28]|nr:MAG: hypothetical protein A3C45_07645 [Deltaproteobacteria bacterium RIFCSPHIGHO2_02_FULL_40_28]OGQ20742.1 MAG: hypothetical protein A3E27_07310 [Deltaproteobacteria bacterium RIFCSPHIGHO2_12_FULL_40_32]OGQ41290.1 MAG: hypothetical protein A3I69_04230 [Deltaproteobacteria bacterium RIFCSPLOWO2_02_FULL_40_36]OGQ55354.1 MAG: hypothetical protein A3G32_09375 [Deltaproteobacteria bacterium RIFCSPLOWO2_12_FULL_40_28]